MPTIPVLTKQVPRDVERAILAINASVDQAHAHVATLKQQVVNPGPLTKAQLTQIQKELSSSGTTPLDIAFLVGGSTLGLIPIQGPRASIPLTGKPGQLFYANDLNALYIAQASGFFVMLEGSLLGSSAGRPGSLSAIDAGYVYYQQEGPHSNISVWTGATWRYIVGYLSGTLGSIPAAAPQYDGTEYYATDFDRVYICVGGAAWQDAPGQPKRKEISFFDAAPDPATGWQLCDGSTVTISTKTGGTASYTTRDLLTGNKFIRSNSSSGGTGGANSTVVSIPGQTTSNDSGTQTVQSGAGATVPAEPHTHTTPSQNVTFPTVPLYMDLIPYVRL